MKLAGKTDKGGYRSENQDNYRAARLPDDTVWAVVCDGMGGAAAGRLASQIATDALEDCFAEGLTDLPEGGEQALLARCIAQANRAVYDESLKDPANRGMGTTAVCVLVRRGVAHVAHVGDSRAYLCRPGELVQLTVDHTMVQQMVESGQLTSQQAAHHPHKNLITKALGVEPEVEGDYTSAPVKKGDVLLLCSDGLSGAVPAEQLQDILEHTPFFITPRKLVERALAAGSQDNVTAVLVGVEPTED